jgi:hypothetical protein
MEWVSVIDKWPLGFGKSTAIQPAKQACEAGCIRALIPASGTD